MTTKSLLMVALICACDVPAENPDVAEMRVALTMVPSGVLCVQVKVAVGSQTVTRNLDVMAGASSVKLPLGQLPAGQATVTGSAFAVACSAVTSTTTAQWIADAAMATLQPGLVTDVELTFRRNNPVTATVNFLDNVAEITTATESTYARMTNGTVKQWGNVGTSVFLVPTDVPGLTNAIQVAVGSNFACARRSDLTLACWGSSQEGALGPGVPVGGFSVTPVAIPLPGPVDDVAAGSLHACASVNGGIFCWGNNVDGQLGNGTTVRSQTPVFAGIGSRIFAGQFHTCAVRGDGTLTCWGFGGFGQIGDGSTVDRLTPTVVPIANTVDMALGGSHTCAVRADGTVRCWGAGASGQLGDGTSTQRSVPVLVQGLTDATQIAAGLEHTCARRQNGTVSCWGGGSKGQLGDGSGDNKALPLAVPGLAGVLAVRSHFSNHTCAELGNRTVKCWGSNSAGQLGDGTLIQHPTPTDLRLK
jgi:alpha-tubulin suppressor-like RCC1 family protein